MKEVHEVRVPITAIAGKLGIEPSKPYFDFLLRRVGSKDVRQDGDDLVHVSFLPLELMLQQAQDELRDADARVEPCRGCERIFDADRDDGIFADPARLEGFVCRPCAEAMDAWTYYNEVLVTP